MPRRNHRHRETYEPLDLTPADVRKAPPAPGYQSSAEARKARAERAREAAQRQADARINHGIDWSVCLVPGCGEELTGRLGGPGHPFPYRRDHQSTLPLCFTHLGVAYRQGSYRADDPLMVQALALAVERKRAVEDEFDKRTQREWLESKDGHIYFVRLNGLVKVGWSRDVDTRLRAYGPDVEVLAIHPGTQSDETNLHRQLRPALARGREWYEDGKIIADFVARAVAEHGEPRVYDAWTRPKQVIRPRKRSA